MGTLQVAKVIDFGFKLRITWQQRALQICFSLGPHLSGINRTVRSWAVLVLVSSGKPLVIARNKADLEHVIAIAWLINLLCHLENLIIGSYCGYREIRRRKQGCAWLSPYLAMATMRELLPRYISGTKVTFIPTALLDSSLKERDEQSRAPFLTRVSRMVLQQGLWYHLLMMTVVFGLIHKEISTSRAIANQEARCQHMWTHSLAPGLDWDSYFDLLAPLAYAFVPSTVPPRRELLGEPSSDKIQCRLPKKTSRLEKWDWWWLIAELPRMLLIISGTIVRFRLCPK